MPIPKDTDAHNALVASIADVIAKVAQQYQCSYYEIMVFILQQGIEKMLREMLAAKIGPKPSSDPVEIGFRI